jgi:hypothetical protein
MPKPTIAEAQAFAESIIDMMCLMIAPGYSVRRVRCVRSIKSDDKKNVTLSDVTYNDGEDGGPSLDLKISMVRLGTVPDWRVAIATREAHELFHAKTREAEERCKRDGDIFPEGELVFSKPLSDLIEDCGNIVETVVTYCLTHDVRIETISRKTER